jgi:hypothetical protein
MEPDVLNRLRRVAGRQTTRLTHYGRRTGKPYEVTIWFAFDGEKFYISTANVKRHRCCSIERKTQASRGDRIPWLATGPAR